MKYQKLGNSDIHVSRVGFGCMSLHSEEKENIQLINEAVEQGINYFDTADMYDKGGNEILLGKALEGKRKEIIIATKVGNQWKADGSGWDWNPTKSYILQEVENSLRRLRTDYIDLYQLHGGTIEDNIPETIEAFELLKQQGKIRYYGISSIRPNVIRDYVNNSHIVSVMMQYSLLDRRPEESALPLLHSHNISVVTRGSLASGLLIDKTAKDYLGYASNEVQAMAMAVSKYGIDPTATALDFVWTNPTVAAAVVGIRTKNQLQQAIQAENNPEIPAEIMEKIKQTLIPLKYEQHR